LFNGGKGFVKPDCITPDYNGFTIEWGYDYEDIQSISGYQLDDKGNLYFYLQDRNTMEKKVELLNQNITGDDMCKVLDKLNSVMLKMPTINEPGRKRGFIILRKPEVSMANRAYWNEYNTFGSTGYRELFDILMSFISAPENKK
jgi:hypothetical protein